MRFFLTGNAEKVEVIGEEVKGLPHAGGEIFAVHHVILPAISDDEDDLPLFAVSHVGTGFRAASGDSIEEAIENARAIFEKKGPTGIKAAIEKAQGLIAAMGES